MHAQTFEFIENKGQFHADVRFQGALNSGAVFLNHKGYRVLQYHEGDFKKVMETVDGHGHGNPGAAGSGERAMLAASKKPATEMPDLNVRSHAYQVSFKNASTTSAFEAEKVLPGVSNYFIGNDPAKWAAGVSSYASIWQRNLYAGIDVHYYSEGGFLKYDLVCKPGAAIGQLALSFEGVEALSVDKGELVIKTTVSVVKERKPYAYQVINGVRKTIDCQYEVSGTELRYRLKGYDPAYYLVIDPTIIFSSFTGSQVDNWGYTATYDAAGNLYAGGVAFGNGYPVTPGAFQTSFAGGSGQQNSGKDIALMKFNADGTQRLYATYVGGSGEDQPHSLIVDGQNNLILAGRTTSANYPTTRPTVGGGGGWDIVVTKLNATGSALIGSLKVGGTLDDGVNIADKSTPAGSSSNSLVQNYGDDSRSEVFIDQAGAVIVAACTRSANFPTTAGAVQTALNGQQDAVVLKFDASVNTMLYSTLFGGSNDDAAYVIRQSANGNYVFAGGTASSNLPGNSAGTVGAAYSGGIADGFIAEMPSTGGSIVRTTYIGTGGIDQIYGIGFDQAGFLYFTGTSTGNFTVRNATFSQPGGKQFIGKLQPDLSAYVYSTVFGNNVALPNISPTAFLVDRCENVFVSGWGGRVGEATYNNSGTAGLTVTPDAFQPSTDGRDFYFFVLEKNAASQLFGSFFGEQNNATQGTADHVDGGTSRFDEQGIIYQGICANCQKAGQFPITPGVVGPNNLSPGGGCNQAVVKINFDLSGVRGGIRSSIRNVAGDTTACLGVPVVFTDTVAQAKRYEWSFGDGGSDVTTVPQTQHTYNSVGVFRVMLIAIDSTKCFPRDTTYVNISVKDNFSPVAARANKLLPCESNSYRFDNLTQPLPGLPFRSTSFTWIFGDNSAPVVTDGRSVNHSYASPGTYEVALILNDSNYCNSPDTARISLRVSPLVVALFETPPFGCAPYEATFNNTSLAGATFNWSFGDGATSTDENPTHLYVNPGTYTVRLEVIDSNTCNVRDDTTMTIQVNGSPNVDFSFLPNPAEENIATVFTNLSDNLPYYKWDFGDGDSLETFRRDTLVRHLFNATGTYQVCLLGVDQFGCADSVCKPVDALINPLLDVVNAFTPNGDGINDRAVVIGFGLTKFVFRIYNRWGQLMFETNSVRNGWDGNFKGKPQPMDAYAYTLEAELVDGKKYRRSGSITLVR